MEHVFEIVSDPKWLITAAITFLVLWGYRIFSRREILNKTKAEIEKVKDEMNRIYSNKDYNCIPFIEVVDCDVCGCMLFKFNAIKGESTVEKVPLRGDPNMLQQTKEVIKQHYYCKAHAPKGGKR